MRPESSASVTCSDCTRVMFAKQTRTVFAERYIYSNPNTGDWERHLSAPIWPPVTWAPGPRRYRNPRRVRHLLTGLFWGKIWIFIIIAMVCLFGILQFIENRFPNCFVICSNYFVFPLACCCISAFVLAFVLAMIFCCK